MRDKTKMIIFYGIILLVIAVATIPKLFQPFSDMEDLAFSNICRIEVFYNNRQRVLSEVDQAKFISMLKHLKPIKHHVNLRASKERGEIDIYYDDCTAYQTLDWILTLNDVQIVQLYGDLYKLDDGFDLRRYFDVPVLE